MSNFFQGLDPSAAPSPVTPADSPSDAAGWSEVSPAGMGPAPYDISAPQSIAAIEGAAAAAGGLTGVGIIYPDSPRQAEARAFMDSPQGSGAASVLTGFPDYESTNVSPGAALETPVQGMGDYPGTKQDGIPMYGTGGGISGVIPEAGSMDGPATGYPGTTQDGVPKYGTS